MSQCFIINFLGEVLSPIFWFSYGPWGSRDGVFRACTGPTPISGIFAESCRGRISFDIACHNKKGGGAKNEVRAKTILVDGAIAAGLVEFSPPSGLF